MITESEILPNFSRLYEFSFDNLPFESQQDLHYVLGENFAYTIFYKQNESSSIQKMFEEKFFIIKTVYDYSKIKFSRKYIYRYRS